MWLLLGELLARLDGGLRLLLADGIGCGADAVAFGYHDRGKPYLDAGAGADFLGKLPSFNLSHSGGVAALAVSSDGDVGIDIEAHRSINPSIAKRYFSPLECAGLDKLDPAERLVRFFDLWVGKEAALKASGLGVGGGLDQFSFDVDALMHGRTKRVGPLSVPPTCGSPEAWKICFFDPMAIGAREALMSDCQMSGAVAWYSETEKEAAIVPRFRVIGFDDI
ncbi:MAG: 4'-phosphopantetheinyl transferase superfamily protein [Pseudomonadota bacterium]